MKRYKVITEPKAQAMLWDNVYYLAKLDEIAGANLAAKLFTAIESLSEFPERFPRVDPEDDMNPYRKMFVPNWYIILYTVEEDTVYVEYVLDGRQDYGWLIEGQ